MLVVLRLNHAVAGDPDCLILLFSVIKQAFTSEFPRGPFCLGRLSLFIFATDKRFFLPATRDARNKQKVPKLCLRSVVGRRMRGGLARGEAHISESLNDDEPQKFEAANHALSFVLSITDIDRCSLDTQVQRVSLAVSVSSTSVSSDIARADSFYGGRAILRPGRRTLCDHHNDQENVRPSPQMQRHTGTGKNKMTMQCLLTFHTYLYPCTCTEDESGSHRTPQPLFSPARLPGTRCRRRW